MGLPCKTASCFQLGVRFPDGTLQTTAATPSAPTTPAGSSGSIQFNNGGVFGGETFVTLVQGGTGADLSATGGASFVLRQSSVGGPITVSQLSYSDISGAPASGTVLWSSLGNAVGNLTLSNAGFTTEFDQTSAVNWTWANTTAAVATGVNAASPIHNLSGTYFTLGASAVDTWSLQNIPATAHISTTVTNITETAGFAVTLAITGGNFVVGDVVTFTGLTTGTWLNNTNQTILTASATQLTFTDNTSHGLQASHAETGQVTQSNPLSTLHIAHSGSALGTVQIPAGSAAYPSLQFAGTSLLTGFYSVGVNTLGLSGGITTAAIELRFQTVSATGSITTQGSIGFNVNSGTNTAFEVRSAAAQLALTSSNDGTTQGAMIIMGGATIEAATTGTQSGVQMGVPANNHANLTFSPTSGTAAYNALFINPTINQATVTLATITSASITNATTAVLSMSSTAGLVNGATAVVSGLAQTNNLQLNGTWVIASISAGVSITITGIGWSAHGASADTGTVTQQAAGSYTGLKIAVIETSLGGTNNKLIDCYAGAAGATAVFSITNGGHLNSVADFAGQATITAAATTKAVTFAANYTGTGQPIVVITPTSDPLASGVPVGYWVTYQGSAGAWTGFTVNIQSALAGNVVFNYIVIGNR